MSARLADDLVDPPARGLPAHLGLGVRVHPVADLEHRVGLTLRHRHGEILGSALAHLDTPLQRELRTLARYPPCHDHTSLDDRITRRGRERNARTMQCDRGTL